jgi:integrase
MTVDNAEQQDKLASEKILDAVSIFLRGQTWCANFQANGKQRRQSLKTRSKKEARRRALLIEAALLKREYQSPAKAAGLDNAISAYEAYLRTEQRAAKTIGKYGLIMKRLADLAERHKIHTLQQVDIKLIDAYRAERVAQGAEPKTLHNETTILRQLVNFGLSRGMIQSDPLKGLKIKKPKPKRQPFWSRAQMDQILAAAGEQHLPALTLLAETGARVGEIKCLTWDDIDSVVGLIHIRTKDVCRPKTGDQRSVPMSPAACAVLKKLSRVSQWVVTAKPSPQFPAGGHQDLGASVVRAP